MKICIVLTSLRKAIADFMFLPKDHGIILIKYLVEL